MMTYEEVDNLDINEILSSWVMTDKEKENYVNHFRSSPHLFMPTVNILLEYEQHDLENLLRMKKLNRGFYLIKRDDKILSVATIIDYYGWNTLVYLTPFRYQNDREIFDVIKRIKAKNKIENIKRFSDLDSPRKEENIKIPVVREPISIHERELNSIKGSIDRLIENGIDKETIISEIYDYLNKKTYHK